MGECATFAASDLYFFGVRMSKVDLGLLLAKGEEIYCQLDMLEVGTGDWVGSGWGGGTGPQSGDWDGLCTGEGRSGPVPGEAGLDKPRPRLPQADQTTTA